MNKIHRVVWSEARSAYIVAHEKARAFGKPALSRSGLGLAISAILASGSPLALAVDQCGAGLTNINTALSGNCVLGDVGAADAVVIGTAGSLATSGIGINVSSATALSIVNLGTIVSGPTSINLDNDATLTGQISNGGSINGAIIVSSASAVDGGITNSGTIDNGILVQETSSVDGGISNSGLIARTGQVNIAVVSTSIVTGGITNAGTLLGAIEVATSSSVNGGISNSGTIVATGPVRNGIEIESASTIESGITNSGSISASGDGIEVDESMVTGSIVNSGSIDVSGNSSAVGIAISNSDVTGGVTNSGTITASSVGIGISASSSDSSVIGGVTNSGLIVASTGIVVEFGAEITGGINNSGTIAGSSLGIRVDSGATVSGGITNSGLIDAGSLGILILSTSDVRGGVSNSGTISASTVGVAVAAGSMVSGGISNSGFIDADSGTAGIIVTSGSTVTGGINNSGTIDGGSSSILVMGNSVDAINLSGTAPRLIGDLNASTTPVNVLAGANFANDNAFDVLSVNVANGATFTVGAGPTSSGATAGINVSSGFTNSGTTKTQAGTVGLINGDYTQTSDGTLSTQVASSTSFGQLQVVGTATLPSNAKIDVDVTSGNLVVGDGLQDILVASTLDSDGTFAVTDNSFLFNFSAALDGNTIDLTVEQGTDIVQTVQNADNSPAFGAAVVLSQLIDSFSEGQDVGDFEAVIDALSTLTTEEELNDAVSQVLPVVSAGGGTALAGAAGRAANIIQSRVGGSGLSGGDGYFEDKHFWAKLHGSWIDQDDRKGISGYDGDAKGFVFGADGELASGTRLGAALSFARTDIDGNSAVAPQTTEVETWELTGYGSYRIDPQMSFDFQLALGHGNAEGARTIRFMPGSPVARSDYDSLSFRASGALSRAYAMGGNTEIVPSIRADYTLVKTDDYTETGAGALNLNVASDTTKAFIVGLDATVNHRANETTVLTANAGVGYDLLDEDASVTSSFAGGGAAFSTPGIDSERIIGRLGVGVNVEASEGLTFSARYDLEAREDFSNQTGSLRMRWKF